MMATTAARNPTETMMPRRVKKERSLLVRIAARARRMASEKGMRKTLRRKDARTQGGRKDEKTDGCQVFTKGLSVFPSFRQSVSPSFRQSVFPSVRLSVL